MNYILNLREKIDSNQNSDIQREIYLNKYNDIFQKYQNEIEMHRKCKDEKEKIKKMLGEMRCNYYKELNYIKEINFRNLRGQKNFKKLEVKYFTIQDSLDNQTKFLLNQKLEEMKNIYECNLNSLNNKIEELEEVITEQNQQINKLKEFDLDDIMVVIEKLKEVTQRPQYAWKCIKKVFGDSLIKHFIIEEIGEIETNLDFFSEQFEEIEDRLKSHIINMEKKINKKMEIEKENLKNLEDTKTNKEEENEKIKKLENDIFYLNIEMKIKENLIRDMEETILKKGVFSNRQKQEVFNLLSDRLKCNTLVKVNNLLIELMKPDHKFSINQYVQVETNDFKYYLKELSQISDYGVMTDNQTNILESKHSDRKTTSQLGQENKKNINLK